jgi:hypothetical protein
MSSTVFVYGSGECEQLGKFMCNKIIFDVFDVILTNNVY